MRQLWLPSLITLTLCVSTHHAVGKDEPLIPPGHLTACLQAYQTGQLSACQPLAKRVKARRAKLESECEKSNLIGVKTERLLDLAKLEGVIQTFALDTLDEPMHVESRSLNEMCGRALDPSVTFVQFEPDPIELEVGESKDVKAVIRCSNGTCEGDLTWTVTPVPSEGPIAEVMETFVDAMIVEHAEVEGVRHGTTTLSAYVDHAFVTPGIPWVFGAADVLVGENEENQKIDIVFAIENSIGHAWAIGADGWGGGFIQNAQTIVDTLEQDLPPDTRIAIVTYNRPGIEPYNVIDDDCPSGYGDGYSAQTFVANHLPFTSLSNPATLYDGWSSIKATCAYSKDGDYRAASAYSALTHSMDGESLGGWREDARKLVILVARHRPAGPYFPDDNWVNEPEGLTGLTQDDVVNLAWDNGVEIHIFNTSGTSEILDGWVSETGGCGSWMYQCGDGSIEDAISACPEGCVPINIEGDLACPDHYVFAAFCVGGNGPRMMEGSREVYMSIASQTGGIYVETAFTEHNNEPYRVILEKLQEFAD